MPRDHGTAEQTYILLRIEVLTGRLDARSRLDFAELSTRFGVSTTPVREAAMRLLGEGSLELHPHGGLRPVLFSEQRLRTLLTYQERLASMAIDWACRPIELQPRNPAWSNEARARALFGGLARASGNSEFYVTIERLADRLAPYRHVEAAVDDLEVEYALLEAAIVQSTSHAKREIRRFHRHRQKVVPKVVWLVVRSSLTDIMARYQVDQI